MLILHSPNNQGQGRVAPSFRGTVFFGLYDTPDHKTHLGFRGGKKERQILKQKIVVLLLSPVTPALLPHHAPPPTVNQVNYIQTIRCTPISISNGGASYSLKIW